jgi:hypothetical protein
MIIETKICKGCNIEQPVTKFTFSKFKRRDKCNRCRNKGQIYKHNSKHNSSEYYRQNKERLRAKQREYVKRKRLKDPLFKLKSNTRNLICASFRNRGVRKKSKTFLLLGCTPEEFKQHLEKQFDSNMNWDNYGSYWVIDHIKPISLAKNENDLLELNKFSNLRPLEKIANLIKSDNYINI